MKIRSSGIFREVLLIEPDVYQDKRGYFSELYSSKDLKGGIIPESFVQDNISYSEKNALRGLHYQAVCPQGKLVTVLDGAVYDVCVDIRADSSTFGRYFGVILSSSNHYRMYIPEGFAHGFCVLSDHALFYYKCTSYYYPDGERGIVWNDPDINIQWPLSTPVLSEKDMKLPTLRGLTQPLASLSI